MQITVSLKQSIIAGVIASLIVIYFLDPILTFLARILLSVSSIAFKSYLDRLYCEIATSDPNIPFFFLLMLCGFGTGSITVIFLSYVFKSKIKESTQLIEKAGSVKRFYALILVASFGLILLTVDCYIRLKISSTFRQHMTVIAPTISEQEYKEFFSSFALIENKADYDALTNSLEEVAQKNGLKLPKNKLYYF